MLLLPAPELPSFACVGMHMQANIDVLWQCLFWWSRPPCVNCDKVSNVFRWGLRLNLVHQRRLQNWQE